MMDRTIAFSISVHLVISIESVDDRYSILQSPSLCTNKVMTLKDGLPFSNFNITHSHILLKLNCTFVTPTKELLMC